MRLIDADTLSREIQNYFKEQIEQHKYEVDVVDCNAELQKILNDHPTAYDVEAVVEKMEERKHNACILTGYEKTHGSVDDRIKAETEVRVLKDAIDIVRSGGKE